MKARASTFQCRDEAGEHTAGVMPAPSDTKARQGGVAVPSGWARIAWRTLATWLVLTAVAVRAADWPQFRGPMCNGISDDLAVPTMLNTNQNLAWMADLPGRGLSSPIIIGDRIFITCSSGSKGQTLHVICLRAADGAKLWERRFFATGRTICQSKTCMAAPTPASDGQHVVAIFSSNDAVCLDLDGNLIWFRGLGRDYPNAANSLGMSSSLLIAGGVAVAEVECESDSFIAGLDLATGVNRWKLERPRKSNWTSPIRLKSGGKELVVITAPTGVAALEPETGKIVWEDEEGHSSIASGTLNGGKLFVPGKRGLMALQVEGAGKPTQLWQSTQLRAGTASPIALEDRVFLLGDGGILTCGMAATGEKAWKLRLNGAFSASPVAVGHFLFCVSEKGEVQVVDTSKPEGEVVRELNLGETILSTPSISNGAIYFRSDGHLWKFGQMAAKEAR